ncbi:MAG: hypothetical protein MUF50_00530 [Planctomycetes bacterium]|jgi:hypothetical protein|nr:hypothetical protein [Planctomycetota bacterium]
MAAKNQRQNNQMDEQMAVEQQENQEIMQEEELQGQKNQASLIAQVSAKKKEEQIGKISGLQKATNSALKWAWEYLIPTIGLSLIYINVHVFGSRSMGEKYFCKLGYEWVPDNMRQKMGSKIKQIGEKANVPETAAFCCLDSCCILSIVIVITGLILLYQIVTGEFVLTLLKGMLSKISNLFN